eukprot:TRINITY_DN19514_c0_g1_i1.p1 TRINITY_DN19514_c0_g1~~TRINITY_DN19514_c0_g1_i1.p1  ORF type:complete len:420 (+),score=106.63 TRINITY_DN19514_c0_g1_i1:74-1261(+)
MEHWAPAQPPPSPRRAALAADLTAAAQLSAAADAELSALGAELRAATRCPQAGLWARWGAPPGDIAWRLQPVAAAARLPLPTVAARLAAAEAEWAAALATRGWALCLAVPNRDCPPPTVAQLAAQLAALRARRRQLDPDAGPLLELDDDLPPPRSDPRGPPRPEPRTPAPGTPLGPRDPPLAVGELAEVRILSGRYAGEWVECSVHRARGGPSDAYDIHVLPTVRFDSAVGNSDRLLLGVPRRHLRSAVQPRVVCGGEYEARAPGGAWVPVRVLSAARDGRYCCRPLQGGPSLALRREDFRALPPPPPPPPAPPLNAAARDLLGALERVSSEHSAAAEREGTEREGARRDSTERDGAGRDSTERGTSSERLSPAQKQNTAVAVDNDEVQLSDLED